MQRRTFYGHIHSLISWTRDGDWEGAFLVCFAIRSQESRHVLFFLSARVTLERLAHTSGRWIHCAREQEANPRFDFHLRTSVVEVGLISRRLVKCCQCADFFRSRARLRFVQLGSVLFALRILGLSDSTTTRRVTTVSPQKKVCVEVCLPSISCCHSAMTTSAPYLASSSASFPSTAFQKKGNFGKQQ